MSLSLTAANHSMLPYDAIMLRRVQGLSPTNPHCVLARHVPASHRNAHQISEATLSQ